MRKTVLGLVAFMFTFHMSVLAQTAPVDMELNVVKSYAGWKSKTNVHISGVEHVTETQYDGATPNERFYLIERDNGSKHEVKTRFDGAINCVFKKPDDIWNYFTIGTVLNMIQKKGFQTSLRNELEDDAIDFINRLENDGRAFSDPYLENYIYSLVAKIAPTTLVDGRPGNVNIVILNDGEQNAFTFSNGTIVITTGLLAVLHSEDELVAILSHEIAHFVFDHSIANVNENIKRKKRAEFWAAVATGVAVAADVYTATQNKNYVPGALTMGTAMISSAIASSYLKQQGMEYNHEQETEADEAATRILKLLGYDTNALATALSRMKDVYSEERSNANYFASYTHPSLNERISKLGFPSDNHDTKFEKIVSFAVNNAAEKKFAARRFRQALKFVNQNINNSVGTSNDYILKAKCLLALKNDEASNQEALNSVLTAKTLSSSNMNLYKPEVVAQLRLGKKAEAIKTLNDYLKALSDAFNEMKDIESDKSWDYFQHLLSKEKLGACENFRGKLRIA